MRTGDRPSGNAAQLRRRIGLIAGDSHDLAVDVVAEARDGLGALLVTAACWVATRRTAARWEIALRERFGRGLASVELYRRAGLSHPGDTLPLSQVFGEEKGGDR